MFLNVTVMLGIESFTLYQLFIFSAKAYNIHFTSRFSIIFCNEVHKNELQVDTNYLICCS